MKVCNKFMRHCLPTGKCLGSYFDHTNYLRNWTQRRLQWMDNTTKTLYVGKYADDERFTTTVSPNPSNGELHFTMYLRYNDLVRIRIYNALGQYMTYLDYDPELNGKNELTWNHTLRAGIYFYDVTINGKRESSGKFIER